MSFGLFYEHLQGNEHLWCEWDQGLKLRKGLPVFRGGACAEEVKGREGPVLAFTQGSTLCRWIDSVVNIEFVWWWEALDIPCGGGIHIGASSEVHWGHYSLTYLPFLREFAYLFARYPYRRLQNLGWDAKEAHETCWRLIQTPIKGNGWRFSSRTLFDA